MTGCLRRPFRLLGAGPWLEQQLSPGAMIESFGTLTSSTSASTALDGTTTTTGTGGTGGTGGSWNTAPGVTQLYQQRRDYTPSGQ